ncbi:MAG TPA: Fe-S cluster assembly protein SufD [Alphaproteobacteria bacterium]|nr:Fe-S cluster assembly protein SufD [Alphaproteobacteria bacterium]USO06325.1 MAG: Fe-S cluster assembly protein SufD [Rhodospirillales bacterium]HOO81132.1 Fe-S cluster assembly protein SufD [Alphaproteobacteria bacterium]
MNFLELKNLPTPKDETWKYTNLGRTLPANLVLADKPQNIVIHKNRGQICEQPEDILFTAFENQHTQPRLKIVLEDGAQATMIERHNGEGAYWKNMVTEIELGQGAILHHIRIQNDAPKAVNTNMVSLKAARDAVYNGFALNSGAKLSRHEIHAIIEGENAEVSFNGVNLLNGEQHGDTTILIEHQAPNGRSNQFYRSLLDDKAHGVFQGKVHVHQIAQKTDGYQLSNALLLSPEAEMDTKPELEIYADDVKCSHGATTGQLDEEPLFYLRQRGLNEAQGRFLIIQAFVDEVVDKIVDKKIRSEILEVTQTWLHTALKI